MGIGSVTKVDGVAVEGGTVIWEGVEGAVDEGWCRDEADSWDGAVVVGPALGVWRLGDTDEGMSTAGSESYLR